MDSGGGFLGCWEAGRLVGPGSRRRAMARVAGHLSVDELEARLRSAQDPTAARHFQVIWLLARGHTIADVAAVTSFVPRWIEQLLARYNAHGPDALGRLATAQRERTGAVEYLHVELRLALQLDKSHGRSRGRLGDRLGVAVVVLLCLDVGANTLGRHQPNLVPLAAQDAAEVVSAAAGLHRHDARRQAGRELDHALPAQAPAHDNAPSVVQARQAAAVLAKINPQNRDLHLPLLLRLPGQLSLKLRDGRGGPFHKSWSRPSLRRELIT